MILVAAFPNMGDVLANSGGSPLLSALLRRVFKKWQHISATFPFLADSPGRIPGTPPRQGDIDVTLSRRAKLDIEFEPL